MLLVVDNLLLEHVGLPLVSSIGVQNKGFQCVNIFVSLLAGDELLSLLHSDLVQLASVGGLVLVGIEGDEADGDDQEELDGVNDKEPEDGPNDTP